MKTINYPLLIIALLFCVFLFGTLGGVMITCTLYWLAYFGFLGKPLKGVASLVTAYAPCTDSTSVHTKAGGCIDENTGIIGFLRIKRGFNITTVITDPTTYATAKTAKDIEVIANIEAYWPEQTEVTVPGMAGRVERYSYSNFDLPFSHENVLANLGFYNTWNQNQNYGIAFVTEDYKVLAPLDRDLEPILCKIFAKPVGEQEFGKPLKIAGNIKWKCRDHLYEITNLTKAIVQPDFQI